MADEIKFEEEERENLLYSRFERSAQIPTMVQWLISKGIVKDSQAAKYVLLAFCFVCVVLAFIIPLLLSPSPAHIPSSEEILRDMSPYMSAH